MSGVARSGGAGVGFPGNQRIALPSAKGAWSQQWGGQNIDFDRDAFAEFIQDKGYLVKWEKAVLCPNLPLPGDGFTPRDHQLGCPYCFGANYIYVDAQQTYMLMQGIKLNENFFAYGRWDNGFQMVTAMPEFNLDYFDRLTIGNGIGRFSDRLLRQPGTTVDVLRYPPLTVLFAFWINRARQLQKLIPTIDFNVSADGSGIDWTNGANVPDSNTFYTVCYTYRPRYVVQDLVHQHRDSTVEGVRFQFPMQAVARLDYLQRNMGADPQQVKDGTPFDPQIANRTGLNQFEPRT